MISETARAEILARIRSGLGHDGSVGVPPRPPLTTRVPPRIAGDPAAELALLLSEIDKLGGNTRRLARAGLREALATLVNAEEVRKATAWQTPELKALGVEEMLESLGVEIVSPCAGKHVLAGCDLGITGADGAFPETGTLLLRASAACPRMISLVPRVHLALITPDILLPDLSAGFDKIKADRYWLFVTGPSRTADIELTVTIGVHGPKALYVWALEG